MNEINIWELVARKLAREATANELEALDLLLQDRVDIAPQVKRVLHFWKNTGLPIETPNAAVRRKMMIQLNGYDTLKNNSAFFNNTLQGNKN